MFSQKSQANEINLAVYKKVAANPESEIENLEKLIEKLLQANGKVIENKKSDLKEQRDHLLRKKDEMKSLLSLANSNKLTKEQAGRVAFIYKSFAASVKLLAATQLALSTPAKSSP